MAATRLYIERDFDQAGGSTVDYPAAVPVRPAVGEHSFQQLRVAEALLFASAHPLTANAIASQIEGDCDIDMVLRDLQAVYADRGVNLVCVGGKWAFRTAGDLGYLLEKHAVQQRRLSKAALETLAVIAYHQPATRAEIEEIRGVATSRGTLDVLLETGWVKLRGRRRSPGRPVTYGITDVFLDHFGLESLRDLPGLAELKGAGLLSGNLPPDFKIPEPLLTTVLTDDEDPLDDADDEADLFDEHDGDELLDDNLTLDANGAPGDTEPE